MRLIACAVAMTALLGSGVANAQLGTSRLDHDVQKMWDDTFHPEQRGTPRTDYERRRDAERYEGGRRREADRYDYDRDRRREGDRAEWCRYHPGSCGGGPAYGAAPGYYR